MDIDRLYASLTLDGGITPIQAGAVEKFVQSPISYWCDLHAPPDARDSINLFQQHLFETGHQHQSDVTAESFPEAVQEMFLTEEDGFRRTLEMMLAGELYVTNMPLLCRPIGLGGRPDLLARVDGIDSELGPFSYQVVEIKSARHIGESHILQAAVYNRILGLVQGLEPSEFLLINRDHVVKIIRMADVVERLEEVLSDMRDIAAGAVVEPCHGAGKWPWVSHVNQMAIDLNDVSLLSGIGPAKRQDVVLAGFSLVDEVAEAEESALTQIKGIGSKTAKNLITAAQALVQDCVIRRSPTPEIPGGRTQVFFDFEGTDPQLGAEDLEVTNYLIGTVWRTDNGPHQYLPFFAPTAMDEKANLSDFLEWAHSLNDPVFYHWRPHEKTHLNKMATFYELDPVQLEWVNNRMVDVSPHVISSFAFPCYSQGLKDIAKSLGFRWRQDDVDGLGTVVLYLRFVESGGMDTEAKEKILVYNEDDCLATMYIFDWLLAQK